MTTQAPHPLITRQRAGRILGLLSVGLALVLAASGCSTATGTPTNAPEAPVAPSAQELDQRWGIEVVGLRLTAANHMLDFRYRVLDAAKAAPLFERATQPELIHEATGSRLPVYSPAKTGPLRNSNPPLEGRVYFIFFPNPGFVHAGDKATIEIGEFRTLVHVE